MFYVLLFFILPAFTAWSLLQLFRNQGSGFWFQWQRSFGWLVLWVVPFPFVDVARNGVQAAGAEGNVFDWLISLPYSWLVLYGGRVLQELMRLAGYTGDAILDHQNLFLVLWSLHCLSLTTMVAWLLNRGKTMRHPMVIGFGLYMAVNAAAIVWH